MIGDCMNRHGQMSFSWSDDLLIVKPKGPFNEEGREYVNNRVKDVILNKGLKRWRRLEILDEETMGSPSVLGMVKDLYTWYEDNGCYATAVVVKNSLQIYVIEEMFQSRTVKIFSNISEAEKWIVSKNVD